jgi:FkbM family methyltransferase
MLIPFKDLIEIYHIKPQTILHIGAHHGEELQDYMAYSPGSSVIWIEGNPQLIPILENKIKDLKNHFVFNYLVSDKNNDLIKLQIMSNTQSSSIFTLAGHSEYYPDITFKKEVILATKRLDSFWEENMAICEKIEFINIDIQGAELLALKGLGEKIKHIKSIYTEVNIAQLYKDIPLLLDIDSYLNQHGFQRVALKLTPQFWGDAFYIQTGKKTSYLILWIQSYYYKLYSNCYYAYYRSIKVGFPIINTIFKTIFPSFHKMLKNRFNP